MQRYKIELAYRGTDFYGWQIQPNEVSVQGEIEKQWTRLNSGVAVSIVGCGRTDTGVHAAFYVAHVDFEVEIETDHTVYKLNKMLPESIVIFSIELVSIDFHARFSAVERTYRYFIHQEKSAFLPNSLYHPSKLDFDKMNEAAVLFLGKKDFTSLSKLHTDVKTNICSVSKAKWEQQGEQWYFEISADRFLRNMVRATVGTLLEVGIGKLETHAISEILDAMDRGAAKVSVPAKGLFLWNVEYAL